MYRLPLTNGSLTSSSMHLVVQILSHLIVLTLGEGRALRLSVARFTVMIEYICLTEWWEHLIISFGRMSGVILPYHDEEAPRATFGMYWQFMPMSVLPVLFLTYLLTLFRMTSCPRPLHTTAFGMYWPLIANQCQTRSFVTTNKPLLPHDRVWPLLAFYAYQTNAKRGFLQRSLFLLPRRPRLACIGHLWKTHAKCGLLQCPCLPFPT